MRRILSIGLILISTITSYGQSINAQLLDRFNLADSTLTNYEILTLMFQYRDLAEINENNGLLEEIQKLEQDSMFQEMEIKCLEILKGNPMNFTALNYFTVSQLGLGKIENLESSWNKAQMVYRTIKRFGEGTKSEPYLVADLNDAKSLIFLYWEEGVKIDSLEQADNGLLDAYITNVKGQNEIISFNFNEKLAIRELFFDYHRDFKYYLAESFKPESKYYYGTLLNRFNNQDKTLKYNEIIALLIGFTKNEHYKPYGNIDIEREILKLVSSKSYKKALKQSENLLSTNPLNFTALMEEGFSLMKIKNDRSYFPSTNSRMLLDAVLWSGNGSYTRPYFVLSPIDGQTIIKYVLGGKIGTMGSATDNNGYFLDMLEMKKEGKETIALYFNIEHAKNNSEIKKRIEQAVDKLEDK